MKNIPFVPVHPSGLVKRELEAREIPRSDWHKVLGCDDDYANQLFNKEVPVTLEIANNLEKAWQIDTQTWLNLQDRYDNHPKVQQ